MKKSVADHINEVAAATEGFPLPQRILRLGLKRFTMEAFSDEMRIEEMRTKHQKDLHDKMIAKARGDKSEAVWREEYRVMPYNDGYGCTGTCVIQILDCKAFRGMNLEVIGRERDNSAYKFIDWSGRAYAHIAAPLQVSNYYNKMPDSVVASYLAAHNIGFPEITVASGWNHYNDEGKKVRILVGVIAGIMFEIERWEQELEEAV